MGSSFTTGRSAIPDAPEFAAAHLRMLTDAGLLARFHGGVRLPSSTVENIAYRRRQDLHEAGKRRIARCVLQAVPNGCSLIINIGTTSEAIARELLHHKGLRVITNNLDVVAVLSDNPDCEVIVTGGIVRSGDGGLVGEATVDFIRQFKVDIGLIGISSIETDGTLRDFDYREGLRCAGKHRAFAHGLAGGGSQQVQQVRDGGIGTPSPDRQVVHRRRTAGALSRSVGGRRRAGDALRAAAFP
jgi:hypothetical protein